MAGRKYNKETRHGNLVAELINTTQPMTVNEIIQKVDGYQGLNKDAARRQLDRDRKELQEIGVEIELLDIKFADPVTVGYKINPKQYYLSLPNLTREERIALNFTLKLFKIGAASLDPAIYKMGGHENSRAAGGSTDIANSIGNIHLDFDDKLLSFLTAIKKKELVTFDYLSETGEVTTRELEPHEVYLPGTHWHVKGYDRLRGGIRVFRLDRIQSDLKSTKPKGELQSIQDSSITLKPWEYHSDITEPLEAELWVGPTKVNWAKSQIGTEAEMEPDGSAIFKFNVTSPQHLYQLVLEFMDDAEIRGEPKLRKGFIDYLKQLTT